MAGITRAATARLVTVMAITALAAVGLAGCKDTTGSAADPEGTPSAAQPSQTPSDAASPKTAPRESAAPAPSRAPGTPLGMDCPGLLSPQAMYDFNPNFSLVPGTRPDAGTPAEEAVGMQGLACVWVNDTSGATVVVGAAHPAPADLKSLRSAASGGSAVSGLGDAAFFSKNGDTGVYQAFRGPFWVTASSVFFGAPADGRELVSAALSALK